MNKPETLPNFRVFSTGNVRGQLHEREVSLKISQEVSLFLFLGKMPGQVSCQVLLKSHLLPCLPDVSRRDRNYGKACVPFVPKKNRAKLLYDSLCFGLKVATYFFLMLSHQEALPF